MSYKITIDSCGELLNEWKEDERVESVPLTLMVGDESIIDDQTFDQKSFLKKVAECPECPKSACPSPECYMKAYENEAEHIYAVTLSSELSGSYNSAVLGKNLYLEEHPEKKIHVSLPASLCPQIRLTVRSFRESCGIVRSVSVC